VSHWKKHQRQSPPEDPEPDPADERRQDPADRMRPVADPDHQEQEAMPIAVCTR